MPGILGHAHRVLRPGGVVLVGWHLGDQVRLKTEGYGGHRMRVRVYQRPIGRMAEWLRDAGFAIDAEIVHSPDDEVPQGRLLAHRL